MSTHSHEHHHHHSHNHGEKRYIKAEVKKLEHSEIEIEAEISAETLEHFFALALKNAVITAEIDGFRAGKAPENIVLKHIGEINILERAARQALDEVYPEILDDLNIHAIGTPTIAVTKIARGNPLGIRSRTAVMPEVELEDYKKIASETKTKKDGDDDKPVTKEEIDAVIEDMRKATGGIGTESSPTLPEVDDEFASKFGDFKNVKELRDNIAENISLEKKRILRDSHRAEIADRLISAAKIDVPEILIESELDGMVKRFENDVQRSGLKLEDYLSQMKKSFEDIRKEWRPGAEKKTRLELILSHIARTENIKPDEERVKKEVENILSHHKDADRFQARLYIEHVLKNDAVFDFLVNQGAGNKK